MRILLTVHHHLDPNEGVPGSTLQLAAELRRRGHLVTLASFDDLPTRLDPRAKSLTFPLLVARRLAGRRFDAFDVVDATTGDAWLWALLRQTRHHRRPVLVTRSHGLEHSGYEQGMEQVRRGEVRVSWKARVYWAGLRLREVATSLRHADYALLLNNYDCQYAIRKLGVAENRVGTYRHGIDQFFLGRPEPTPRGAGEALRVAQIGRYSLYKGAPYAAAALKQVMRRHPDVAVTFLGTGCPPAAVLADFPPDLRKRVAVVSWYERRRLPALLEGHHVKLFPTTGEGFGLALVEAMACGLAPITTFTPGPSEIVTAGTNGLLIPHSDAYAIEQALERLLEQPALLESIRRNAHRAAQGYTWSAAADAATSLYRRLLAANGTTDLSATIVGAEA